MHAELNPIHFKPGQHGAFVQGFNDQLGASLVDRDINTTILMSDGDGANGYLLSFSQSPIRPSVSETLARDQADFVACGQAEQLEAIVQAGEIGAAQHARVITLPVPNEQLDQARGVYESGYLPLLKQQPGFLAVVWLVDRSAGSGRGISFWTERHLMEAAERDGEFFPKVLKRLAAFFNDQPIMGYFHIDAITQP